MTLLQADPALVRAPQRLRGVITLLGVEVASGMERSNWRLVFPTGSLLGVEGTAESSKVPKLKAEARGYKSLSLN